MASGPALRLFGMAVVFLSAVAPAEAQRVEFGQWWEAGTHTTVIAEQDLDFGGIVRGSTATVELGSPSMGVVSIEAVAFLDLLVELDVNNDGYLFLETEPGCAVPSCRVPITIDGAYTNRGQPFNELAGAVHMAGSYAVLRVRERAGGPPPPPPTPDHEGFVPPLATLFIYLHGQAEAPPNVQVGRYTGSVTIRIEYF